MQAGRNSPTANPNQHTEEELEFIRDIAGGVLHRDCQTKAYGADSGSDVMAILRELGAEGRTIILITHDNNIAATARRIVSDEANVPAK